MVPVSMLLTPPAPWTHRKDGRPPRQSGAVEGPNLRPLSEKPARPLGTRRQEAFWSLCEAAHTWFGSDALTCWLRSALDDQANANPCQSSRWISARFSHLAGEHYAD